MNIKQLLKFEETKAAFQRGFGDYVNSSLSLSSVLNSMNDNNSTKKSSDSSFEIPKEYLANPILRLAYNFGAFQAYMNLERNLSTNPKKY